MAQDAVIQAFARRAATYEEDTPWARDPQVLGSAVELLRGRAIGDLLDVGGGTGVLSAHVRDTLGAHSATVLDVSSDMLARVPHGIERRRANLDETELGARLYDTVLMRQVLHYLDAPTAVLARVRRALREDGRIYLGQIVMPDADAAQWVQSLASKLSPARQRILTAADVTRLVADVGLQVVKTTSHRFPERLGAWATRGAEPGDQTAFMATARSSLTTAVAASLDVVDVGPDLQYQIVWWHGILRPARAD